MNKKEQNRKAMPVRGNGEKGDSLFHMLLLKIVKEDIAILETRYSKYLTILRKANDERLLAVIGSLAVEEIIDSLLEAYIPRYNSCLKGEEGVTFAVKIKLARSLNLIPSHLINAVDIIRKVRNVFAHNLDMSDFNALPEEKKGELINKYRYIHYKDNIEDLSLSDLYGTLVSSLLAIIGAYSTNVKEARDYIYSNEFHEVIRAKAAILKDK